MHKLAAVLPVLVLAACVYGSGGPPPVVPLAQDPAQPGSAFAEHLLQDYFAGRPDAPMVCISMAPRGFTASQETALIARFPRLAPLSRCKTNGGGRYSDAITGGPAAVIEIYEFACDSPVSCAGWASVPGRPSVSYHQRFQDGQWRFAADLRMIAR